MRYGANKSGLERIKEVLLVLFFFFPLFFSLARFIRVVDSWICVYSLLLHKWGQEKPAANTEAFHPARHLPGRERGAHVSTKPQLCLIVCKKPCCYRLTIAPTFEVGSWCTACG